MDEGLGDKNVVKAGKKAAKSQVKLQRYRVWLALAAALVAFITLLATTQPWKHFGDSPEPAESAPSTAPAGHATE